MPAIIGGIISSITIPMATSVTAPAAVVQIAPAYTSLTLTKLGVEGKTKGWFFRAISSDALPGTAAAKYAIDQGMKSLALIDLLQFHGWTFDHPVDLDAMVELACLREEGLIARLGLANFDTAHRRVLGKPSVVPAKSGDEYRRPPLLTACGDLSHHLDTVPPVWQRVPVSGSTKRGTISCGSVFWRTAAGDARVSDGFRAIAAGNVLQRN